MQSPKTALSVCFTQDIGSGQVGGHCSFLCVCVCVCERERERERESE